MKNLALSAMRVGLTEKGLIRILSENHDKDVAKILKVSIPKAWNLRKEFGVPRPPAIERKYKRKVPVEEMKKMLRSTTNSDISRRTGYSRERVRQLRNRWGIPAPYKGMQLKKKYDLEDLLSKSFQLYKDGLPVSAIYRTIKPDLTESGFRQILKSNGLGSKDRPAKIGRGIPWREVKMFIDENRPKDFALDESWYGINRLVARHFGVSRITAFRYVHLYKKLERGECENRN